MPALVGIVQEDIHEAVGPLVGIRVVVVQLGTHRPVAAPVGVAPVGILVEVGSIREGIHSCLPCCFNDKHTIRTLTYIEIQSKGQEKNKNKKEPTITARTCLSNTEIAMSKGENNYCFKAKKITQSWVCFSAQLVWQVSILRLNKPINIQSLSTLIYIGLPCFSFDK